MLWVFFHLVIVLCYYWQTTVLQSYVQSLSNWATCEVVIKVLSPIIIGCDESKSWTLVAWKHLAIYDFHMSWALQWTCTSNYPWQFDWSKFNYFLCKVGRVANLHETNDQVLVFMLDPRFKNMCPVTSYVGHENVTKLVIDNDSQLLLPLFVEFHKSLMGHKHIKIPKIVAMEYNFLNFKILTRCVHQTWCQYSKLRGDLRSLKLDVIIFSKTFNIRWNFCMWLIYLDPNNTCHIVQKMRNIFQKWAYIFFVWSF
jgi:hypothetical protein